MLFALEEDKPEYFEAVFYRTFCRDNLVDLSNILHFVMSIRGPLLQAVKQSTLGQATLTLATDIIRNQPQFLNRYIIQAEDNLKSIELALKEKLVTPTDTPDIFKFVHAAQDNYFDQIGKHENIDNFINIWHESDNILESLYQTCISIIINGGKTTTEYYTEHFMKIVFSQFAQQYRSGNNAALEYCHQLVWIILKYFANDPDEGFFRPYSQNKIKQHIEYLQGTFLLLDKSLSSLNPVALKRAAMPNLIAILKKYETTTCDKIIFDILADLIVINKGIPSLTSKCFSEILKQADEEFYRTYEKNILQLIRINIDNSYYKIPEEFAFLVLLKLGHYGSIEA